jgi:hypothetical protein
MAFLLPDKSYNASIRFPELTVTESFGRTLRATASVSVLSFTVNQALLSYTVWRLARGSLTAKKRRPLWFILGNLVCSELHVVWMFLTVTQVMTYEMCLVHGVVGAPLYVSSNLFKYLVLLERARAVLDRGRTARVLLLFVELATALAVPGLVVFCPVLFQGLVFFKEGYCIQDLKPLLCWIFLVLDSSLSFSYLYLFIEPVMQHLRAMRTASLVGESIVNDKEMIGLARRNLMWSSLTIVSTSLFMAYIAASSTFLTTGALEDPATDSFLRPLSWILCQCDQMINSTGIICIFQRVWLAPKHARWLSRRGKQVNPAKAVKSGAGDTAAGATAHSTDLGAIAPSALGDGRHASKGVEASEELLG